MTRAGQLRLRSSLCSLGLLAGIALLIEQLTGYRPGLGQRREAGFFLPGKAQVIIRRCEIGIGLGDRRLLLGNLRAQGGSPGTRNIDLRLRIGKARRVIGLIDAKQRVAGSYYLIIFDKDFLDVTSDPR